MSSKVQPNHIQLIISIHSTLTLIKAPLQLRFQHSQRRGLLQPPLQTPTLKIQVKELFMERMKFKIILGAGQEGLITSDFDGEPTRDLTRMSWSDQTREIVGTQII